MVSNLGVLYPMFPLAVELLSAPFIPGNDFSYNQAATIMFGAKTFSVTLPGVTLNALQIKMQSLHNDNADILHPLLAVTQHDELPTVLTSNELCINGCNQNQFECDNIYCTIQDLGLLEPNTNCFKIQ